MTEYRLHQGVNGPGAQVTDTSDYTFGVEFYVTTDAWATKIHFWASTTVVGTFPGCIYKVDAGGLTGAPVTGTDVTFGSLTAGWNTASLASGVRLTPGQRYRAAVLITTNNGFTATAGYWTTGAGAAGLSAGPLRAPNVTAAYGGKQASYHSGGTLTFPATGDGTHYWVDVSVSDIDLDALNLSLWAVDPATAAITPLPHATNLSVDLVRNGIGKVTVDYPYYGQGFALLADNVTDDRDLEVEIWVTGKQSAALRAILTDTAGDDVAEDAVWRFEGWDLNVLLDEVLVWNQPAADKQELIFSGEDAGSIIATIVGQAQVRGGLDGVTLGFSTTLDSNGAAWSTTASLTLSPSATLLEVLQELVEIGMIDGFELTADRVLDMWNPGGQGEDRTLTDPPLIFRRGQNLVQSPRRHTVRNSGTSTLVAGADNLYEDADDATALARRGRRIEIAGSANSLKDSGSVLAYAQNLLATVTPGIHEVTHGLTFGARHARPMIDYRLGDWAWSDTRGTLERLRIQQMEITLGPSGYEGSIVLDTTITDRVAAIARKLKRISSGTAVVGTSQPTATTDDGKAPAQVTGVTASSAAYVTNAGVTMASVQAGWSAVTTNADATAADDIVGYFPAYRYGSGQSLATDWQVQSQVGGLVADWSGVVPGKTIDVRVAAVDQWGRLGAWSSAYSLTSGADATPPPTPSTPVVDSYLGILTVAWDGLGSVGESQPPDFDRVDVHVSTSSGFTPDSSTRIDSLRTKGTIPWDGGSYGTTYYGKLIAYDKTGNASAASAQDSALLAQAGDGDISALSIGKLSAGIMSAIMTLSGIIRTASSGDRVEIDTDGIHCYDGSTLVFDFDLSAGTVYVRGSVEAYQSSTDRIMVQPSGAGASGVSLSEISFFAQTLSPGYINGFPATGSRTGLGMNSGNSVDSGTTRRQSTVRLFPQAFDLFVNTAPGDSAGVNQPRGARVSGSDTQLSLQVTDESGVTQTKALLTGSQVQLSVRNDDDSEREGGYVWLADEFADTYFGHFVAGISVDTFLKFTADGNITLRRGTNQFLQMQNDLVELKLESGVRVTLTPSTTILGSSGSSFIRINASGAIEFYEGGSGYASLSALKSFVIDHPTDSPDDPRRWLVHVCTESPVAGVEYTGHVEIRDGRAEAELPDYFEALCEIDGRTVQLTPVGALCRVASEPIANGRFTVLSDAPDGTRVDWLVKAARRGADFPVEPLRSEVQVNGVGPYRYISR